MFLSFLGLVIFIMSENKQKRNIFIIVAVLVLVIIVFFLLSGDSYSETWAKQVREASSNDKILVANKTFRENVDSNERKLPESFNGYLNDKSAAVRKNAALLIGEYGNGESVSELKKRLVDSDSDVRRAVAYSILLLTAGPQADLQEFYGKEQDLSTRTYLAAILALSGKQSDVVSFRRSLGTEQDDAPKRVFSNYFSKHSSQFDSMSKLQKLLYTRELAPALTATSPEVAAAINEFLAKISGHNIKLGDTEDSRILAAHQWHIWSVNQYQKSVLQQHNNAKLQELFAKATGEDKFIIALKLSEQNNKAAKEYVSAVLKDRKQTIGVIDYLSTQHYSHLQTHLASKGASNEQIVAFLLRQNNTASRDALLANWDLLDESTRAHLIAKLSSSSESSAKYRLHIGKDGKVVVVDKKTTTVSNNNNGLDQGAFTKVLRDLFAKAELKSQVQSKQQIKSLSDQRKEIQKLIEKLDSRSSGKDELIRITQKMAARGTIEEPFFCDITIEALQDAGNVRLVAATPENAKYLRSEPKPSEETSSRVWWSYSFMRKGEKKHVRIWMVSKHEGDLKVCCTATAEPVCCANISIGRPKLKITKTGPKTALLGSVVTYKITVQNIGTVAAKDVVVTDIVPSGLTGKAGKTHLPFLIGNLDIKQSKTVTVSLTAQERGEVCNEAVAACPKADTVKTRFCTKILKKDLKLTFICAKEQKVGDRITGKITLENTGDIDLDGVVHMTMFGSAKVLSTTPKLAHEKQKYVWRVGKIPAGAKKYCDVVFTSTVEGNYCVVVDANTKQDIKRTTKCCTLWKGVPELKITKVGPKTALLGSTVTYTVTVQNTGTTTAKNVIVTDIVPRGLVAKTGKTRLSYPVGDLKIKQLKTVTVSLVAQGRGEVCNEAVANCSGAKQVKARFCTKILKKDLKLTFVCAKEQKVGDRITGKITVENTGDVLLDGIVRMTMPAKTKVLSTTPKLAQEKGQYVWRVGKLSGGAKKHCDVVFTSTVEGSYCVTVVANTKQSVKRDTKCCTLWKGTPKLNITKVGPKTAILGSDISYKIKVDSTGTTTAKAVRVTDKLPIHLEHKSRRRVLEYRLGDMPIGTSKTIDVDVKAVRPGKALNSASVSSKRIPPLPADATTIIQRQEATLVMTCVKNAMLGQRMEVKAVATNTGDVPLNNLVIEANAPKNLLIVSGSKATVVKNKVTWKIAELKPGKSFSFMLVVTAKAEGRLAINLGLKTKQGVSRSAECSTLWKGEPKITITKTGPKEAILGQKFSYEVKVTSVGTIAAKGVVITDYLPMHLEHASRKRALRFPIGDMAPKASKTWTVTVTAKRPGKAHNRASATSKNAPTVEAKAITVIKRQDARISINCVPNAMLGQRKEAVIYVQNTGDVPLHGAYVEADYLKNLVITSKDKKVKIAATKTTWQLATLKPGEKRTYRFVYTSKAEGSMCVSVKLFNKEKIERTAKCCTVWKGEPKLKITKVGPKTAILGTKVLYMVRVESIGTTTAKQVVVRDTLPRHLQHSSKKTLVEIPVGDMPVGAVKILPVATIAIHPGTAHNKVGAYSSNAPKVDADATTIIKRQEAKIDIRCIANAMLTNKAPVKIYAKNTGDTPLNGVVVTANVDKQLAILSSEGKPKTTGNTVVWNIAKLAPGEEKTYNMQVTAKTEGKWCISANLTTTEKVGSKSSCCTAWKGVAQLKISKTGPPTAILGTPVSYKIRVESVGTIAAKSVVVIDTLPMHLEHKSGKRTLQYPLGDLAPKAWKEVVVTTKAIKTGTAKNGAIAQSKNAPVVKADATTVIRRLDAKLWAKCTAKAMLGDRVAIEITLENSGDIDLSETTLTTNLDKGHVALPGKGKPTITPTNVSWKIAKLKAGVKQTYSFILTSKAEGNLCLVMKFTSAQGVTRTYKCCTMWKGEPKLQITKTGPKSVILGSDFEYKIQVKSVGTTIAKNVILTDVLPDHLTHASGKKSLQYPLGDMKVGETKNVTVKVKAKKHGRAVNVADAKSSNAPPVKAEAITVINRLQASLKVKCPPVAYLNKRTPYIIMLQNTGDVPITNVQIEAVATGPLKLLAGSKGAKIQGKKAVWKFPTIQPGKRQALKLLCVSGDRGESCVTVTVSNDQGVKKQEKCCSLWKGYPAILLEVIDTEDPLLLDEETTYIISIKNQGTADDRNIKIIIECPPETNPTTFSGPTKGTRKGKKVIFEPYKVLKPKETIKYKVNAKALKEGDTRFRVYLTTEHLVKPVTEEESTHVY